MKKTADATAGAGAEKAGQTLYAQVKSQVTQLDKKGKQRIMQLLQKSLTQPAPAAPGAAPAGGGAAPANTMANAPVSKTNKAKPGNPNAAPAGNYDGNTGEPISDKGKADAAAMAAYKASPKGQAQQAAWDAEDAAAATAPAATAPAATAPAAEVPAKKVKGASRVPRKTAPKQSQAEIDADRERNMGNFSDSKIRTGNALAETLMRAIAEEKSRMVAEGKISIFRNTK
jgi:hypothetical protein